MRVRRINIRLLAGGLVGVGALALSTIPAFATSGTAAITAGTFSFVSSPSTVAFADTLNGHDQTAPAAQAFDIGDATGSGTGWNITATSTTFTAGAHTLSTAATTVSSGPTVACDAS